MRLHIATIGSEKEHLEVQEAFLSLAASDAVGQHEPEGDPVRANAILFVDLHLHGYDRFMSRLRAHQLVKRFRRKIFVYDERDQPLFSFPGIYISGTPGWTRRHRGALVGGPYIRTIGPLVPSTEQPDLLFSFRGARTHPLRDRILSLTHPRAVVEDAGDFNSPEKGRYDELLRRSKFVLCPRGYGPSSMRIFETLRARRVPVVIGDDWLPPPGFNWPAAIVRAPESAWHSVPRLLERAEDRWPELLAAGLPIARSLSLEGAWQHYCESIALLGAHGRQRGPWWLDRRTLRAGPLASLGSGVAARLRK